MRWRDVQGYEGLYKVSDEGQVYSIRSGILLKHYVPEDGYHRVKLSGKGKRKHYQIHRLVAKHFCEGYEPGLVANHKDGDKDNNFYWNLEWVTQKVNVANQIARGTLNVAKAQEAAKEKNQKAIVVISPEGNVIEYPSTKLACEKLGLTGSKVTDVLKGRRSHHKGYTFRYVSNGQ